MKKTAERKKLFESIKTVIAEARQQVVRNVNTTMLLTYFEIGRMIAEDVKNGKDRADYAAETLKTLSIALTDEFGKGYSKSNLEYMVGFYNNYKSRLSPIAQSLIGQLTTNFPFQLTWTHYIQLLKISNIDERSFYEIEATTDNWTVRELQRQYNSSLYERLSLSRNKKGVKALAKKGQIIEQTTDALKSH